MYFIVQSWILNLSLDPNWRHIFITVETGYKNIVGSRKNVLITGMFLYEVKLIEGLIETFPAGMFL